MFPVRIESKDVHQRQVRAKGRRQARPALLLERVRAELHFPDSDRQVDHPVERGSVFQGLIEAAADAGPQLCAGVLLLHHGVRLFDQAEKSELRDPQPADNGDH